MSNNKPPQILNQKPEPALEMKIFHKTKMLGWSGLVNIDNIQGWAYNRRIELYRRRCEEQFGRLPTDDEIYEFMIGEKDFQIRELSKSIIYNGVRVPIILDLDGTLLDGNRRYVATRKAIEKTPDLKDELANIPAWVMSKDTTDEHRLKVLVECNFLSDWKVDWNNYTKARTVYDDYTDNDMKIEQLSERYARTPTEIRTMIKVMGLIEEFLNFNNNSDDAFEAAYEHYPWFEEAHNKYRAKLDSDPDFKEQFFDWMIENKFKAILQVRRLGEIRDSEEAWAIINSDDPQAVKTAIHIVDGDKLPSLVDGDKRVRKIIKWLRNLKEQEIISIRQETLEELKSTLTEVIQMAEAVSGTAQGTTNESEDS